MNITKEQKEMDSIINPELYAKVKKKKIKYTKEIEYPNVKKQTESKNDDKKEIFAIIEILFKVLGYSLLFVNLSFGVLCLIIGEVFRITNRDSVSRKGGGVVDF